MRMGDTYVHDEQFVPADSISWDGSGMFIRDASVRIFPGESEFCVTASDLFLIWLTLRPGHVMEVVLDGSYSCSYGWLCGWWSEVWV